MNYLSFIFKKIKTFFIKFNLWKRNESENITPYIIRNINIRLLEYVYLSLYTYINKSLNSFNLYIYINNIFKKTSLKIKNIPFATKTPPFLKGNIRKRRQPPPFYKSPLMKKKYEIVL